MQLFRKKQSEDLINTDPVPKETAKRTSVNWKSYRSEFSLSGSLKYVIVYGLSYILFKVFINLENGETFFSAIPRHFPDDVYTRIILIVLLGHALYWFISNLKNKLIPSPKSVLYFFLVIFAYFSFIRLEPHFELYSYQDWALPGLYYLDLITLTVVIRCLKFQSYQNVVVTTGLLSLIEDYPDPTGPDEFNRESYAGRIAEYILGTTTRTSFNIGIFADWGAGKTDFLLRLKTTLEKANENKDENIIVEFNPWRAGKTDILIDDFFKTLSEKLRPYNKSISSKIVDYSNQLFKTGKEIQLRALDMVINELVNDGSIKSKFDEVNKSLIKTGKRLIIFVDDLDRLSGSEVFEVLKIIRNTANFSNTFFIVGLDEQYVVQALTKTNSITKEQQYLKKIFQLTITLPIIRKNIFQRKIQEYLSVESMSLQDQERINRMLNYIDNSRGHLEDCFDNLRDVKRFCNSFKISFELLKEEVEIVDLALLEMLKLNNIGIYHEIANSRIITHSSNHDQYDAHDAEWKKYQEKYPEDLAVAKGIVNSLIDSNFKNDRSFSRQKNFYLYFSYQLFNLIPLKEFNDLVKESPEKIVTGFQKWISENKDIDLENIMNSYPMYSSKEELEKWITVFLTIGDYFISKIGQPLAKKENEILVLFDKDEAAYSKFLLKFFNNSKIPPYHRAVFINLFLKQHIYNPNEFLFSKKQLQTLLLKLFKLYLKDQPGYGLEIERFFILNDDSRKDDKIILNEEAGNVLREHLSKSKENFSAFITYFIRSYTLPNMENEFTFHPFFTNIYPFRKEFIDQLRHLNLKGDKKRIKEIILQNLESSSFSVPQPFRVNNTDAKFLINHLREIGAYPKERKETLLSENLGFS
ncbi:MAG: family P-loop protein [Mucilaginibacter sp.]|nr:family P-loop protein [Mucilaginibacter sp.]